MEASVSTARRVPPLIRRLVTTRADGRCEVCGQRERGLDLHHRMQRSVGGHDEAFNLLAVCRRCHDRIHSGPATSRTAGWLVDSWQDPLEVPVVMRDGTYLLDGMGGLARVRRE